MPQSLQSRFAAFACLAASILLGSANAAFGQGIPAINEVVPPLGAGVVDQVGLSTVRLTFSEAVTIAPGAIRAWGVASGPIPLTTSWNAAANELTVTFIPAITAERVTLVVGPGITGEFGDELDGEVPNPRFPTIPTGDGNAGGVAVFRWDVLQGDANRDGVTNAADAQAVLAALGTCGIEPLADPDFDANADLNVDGCVNVLDVQILLSGLGGSLPPLDGAPPVIASISRDNGEPLTEDLSDLSIVMSEPIVADGVVPSCVRMRSLDGQLFLPSSTSLLVDERTIACHFDPPLSSCGDYTVVLASSIIDLSGEFFVATGAAPGFTGSTPPPVPILNAYPSATASAGVTLSGTIPDLPGFASATTIRVQGIDQVVTGPAGSTFSITVPLKANNVNLLYVSAISPCGIAGAPVTAEVARDTDPPSLTVLSPVDGATTYDAAISVGGFVGDTLIGFDGLTVSVNGQPAIVDIGSGQLGTWVIPSLPLRNIGPTQLVIAASDALGNTATQSITVTRLAIPKNAATIEKLTGDGQTGAVASSLPQPIRVKVWKADGSPWANKVVDFRVTQNDGRLDGNGVAADAVHFQSLTDASGEASATWTLGSSSGCGNNRVEVTSKDVVGAITFSATALAGAADQINIGTGDDQRIETGGVAPLPLSAWVSDSRNPVAGVPVTFTVVGGNGTVNGASQATVASDATGHAEVIFTAGTTPGANRVRATFPGNATNPAVFTLYGIARDITNPTSFKGLVFDNASQPIGNVKVTLKFQDHFVGPVLSNAQGQFEFPSIDEDGAVHVMVEGFLANKLNGKPLPPGVKFPSLGYDTVIIPHAENSLGRPVLLPPLLPENARVWDGQSDIELTCGGVDGLKYIVKANSMTLVNGSHPTPGAPVTLSINQVHHGAVPMPLPDGASPPFDATFYPPGATFDPPVAVEYPNMSALPPGAAVHFLTFNHDTGEFEAMAPGRVSDDGSTIRSEPGTGLTKSGWHGPGFPFQISGRCASAGLCAQATSPGGGGVAGEAPQCGITINGRCADHFGDFIVRPYGSSPAMSVEIQTDDPDAFISWEVDPVGDQSGTVEQLTGTGSNFEIVPIIGPGVRPIDGSHGVPNAPIAYFITVTILSEGRVTFRDVLVEQSSASILRQEYQDYRSFAGSTVRVPRLALLGPPAPATYFEPEDFNTGNYYPDLSPHLVLNGFMQAIADQCRASYNHPVHIESAYRNPQRNKAVNGVIDSVHMKGGAVDLQPSGSANTPKGRAQLYVASCLAAIGGGIAEKVLLEHNGSQLLPSLWVPPPAPWVTGGSFGGSNYTVTFVDTNDDGLVDQVDSISIPNLPLPGTTFPWLASGTSHPDFKLADADVNGVVSHGDILLLNLSPFLAGHMPAGVPLTLDNIASYSTHVHAEHQGYPTVVPGDEDDEDEDEVVPLPPWTFTVAGQVVTAGPSAAFAISNVNATDRWGPDGPGSPADGFGDEPIRAVGFSVIDGVTTYAYTEPFHISANQNVGLDAMTVTTTPVPMPVSIELSANPILAVGDTTQVTTISHQNDGTLLNVTPASSWTTYSTSNPALATVSADGLVTGHAPGTVFITAMNGAATAVRKIIVTNEAAPTTIVGSVQLADGTPVANAVVVTPLGGKGVSQADGTFQFDVEVASRTTSLSVTAVATIKGVNYAGTALASPVVALGLTDAGAITIFPGADCNPTWLPTFGGSLGLDNVVRTMAVFDDGRGAGPALYLGGDFAVAGGIPVNHIARWDGRQWSSVAGGADGSVEGLVVFDDQLGGGPALYACGSFGTIGGVVANKIARWNGVSWSPLGTGVDYNIISDMAVFDDGSGPELVAGGFFTSIDGVQANSIARWNGRSWSALGSGLVSNVHGATGSVFSLASFDDGNGPALYVGGIFIRAGGFPAQNMARWDGSAWTPIPGMNGPVGAMTVLDDRSGAGPRLYAGGAFNTAGGVFTGNVVRWNGSAWSGLGGGLNASVYVLSSFDDGSGPALIAGGEFYVADGPNPGYGIARWNGSEWTSLAGGLNNPANAIVSMEDGRGGNTLFVGGMFWQAGTLDQSGGAGISAPHIARWDGSTWSTLGKGLDGGISALAVFDDGRGGGPALYAGGYFSGDGVSTLAHIGRWDGAAWIPLGTGIDGPVRSLTTFDDGTGSALYAGGNFSVAGGTPVNNIARWDGSTWSALGSGLDSYVFALTTFDDRTGSGPALYAGGWFSADGAGEFSLNHIARWDGSAWTDVGGGVGGHPSGPPDSRSGPIYGVSALTTFDNGTGPALYVGGVIAYAGQVPVQHVARWDGATWSGIGWTGSEVYAMTPFDAGLGRGAQLMVAGNFAGGIAGWDGVSWSFLGGGTNGTINSLVSFNAGFGSGPELFVGGWFDTAGGVAANHIARWDGSAWSAMGEGLSGAPNALCMFDDGSGIGPALIAGGSFYSLPAGDSFAARWGCNEAAKDAPRRPHPASVPHASHRAPPAITARTSDLRLRAGDSLILGDETRRYGSVVAEAGSTIRLTSRDSHLIVTNLTVEPGATFEWLGGTIEIDGGAWLHPYHLTIGCDLDARLVLHAGAFVRAPKLLVCEMGSLVGEGAVDAFVQNGGAIAGEGSGLRLLGGYVQEPAGTIIASIAELDAVVAGRTHACSAVDALPFTTGRATHQLLDVDGDGDLDLVRTIGTAAHSVVAIWLHGGSKGDGPFGTPILCSADAAAATVTIADLNGDGVLDLELTFRDGDSEYTLLSGGDVEVTR